MLIRRARARTVLISLGICVCTAPGVAAQDWLAFRSTVGHEWLVNGDLADPLSGDTRSEWTILFHRPAPWPPLRLRAGVGISRVTYGMNAGWPLLRTLPVTDEHSRRWNHVGWHLLIGLEVYDSPWIDIYVERRRVWGRLRPQDHTLWEIKNPPLFKDRPYREWGLVGWDDALGFKSDFNGKWPVHLDITLRSGHVGPRFGPELDMSEFGLGVRHEASTFGIQIGVYWAV